HLLRATALLSMAVIAFYLPIEGVILPAYFTKMQTPTHLGWVLMAMSVGGLLGALSYGQWADCWVHSPTGSGPIACHAARSS
ncbi:MAG: hypothetical protein ACR2OU_09805, partial [Thermomicrobiales bacterium]